jgi:AcrR family transcriptional regulator
MLKRLSRGKEDPQAVEDLLEHCVHGGLAQEEVLEQLICCFLQLWGSCKQGAFPSQFPPARLVASFKKVAQKKNISPETFFEILLERMVAETESDGNVRCEVKKSSKEKILEAALEVFSEKGFHLATVDEIADRAGVGKGTLYRYFANKETLFNELVRLRLEELEASAMAVLDGQDDVLTMISKYLRTYFEFFDHNQRLYRLIVQERLDVGEQVQDLYLKKVMRRIPLLKRKIYGASQQGVLKDVDFQTVFYGVMGFVHGVIQKWLARDCSYSLVEELPGVVEVLFYGFVNKPMNANEELKDSDQGGENG